jgi:signal transduction histidine kinase
MNSLRNRLIAGLFLAIAAFWGTWYAAQLTQVTREQTALRDKGLQEVAKQILLSLNRDITESPVQAMLALPADASFTGEKLSFQVWAERHHTVLRSPGSPMEALKPDFLDGFADRRIRDEDWRVFAISDSTGRVNVQVGKPKSYLLAEQRHRRNVSLIYMILLLALLSGVIWIVVRWSLKPVVAVQAAMKERTALDLEPLPLAGLPDEIRPLVESFNRLLHQLDEAIQGERRFIADAAHELRTPLAALLAQAQVAMRAPAGSEEKAALQRLVAGVERSARLSEQLLDMARLDADDIANGHERAVLYDLMVVVVRDFETAAAHKRQMISLNTEPCVIFGHVDELGILIRNLVDNALRYAAEGGRIAVSCRCLPLGGKDMVCLQVADDGPGVPEAERRRIFDRFYRVPGNGGRGSGIGLSLVARIAQRHGADIEVGDGLEGRGFGIAVWFPAAPPETTK